MVKKVAYAVLVSGVLFTIIGIFSMIIPLKSGTETSYPANNNRFISGLTDDSIKLFWTLEASGWKEGFQSNGEPLYDKIPLVKPNSILYIKIIDPSSESIIIEVIDESQKYTNKYLVKRVTVSGAKDQLLWVVFLNRESKTYKKDAWNFVLIKKEMSIRIYPTSAEKVKVALELRNYTWGKGE